MRSQLKSLQVILNQLISANWRDSRNICLLLKLYSYCAIKFDIDRFRSKSIHNVNWTEFHSLCIKNQVGSVLALFVSTSANFVCPIMYDKIVNCKKIVCAPSAGIFLVWCTDFLHIFTSDSSFSKSIKFHSLIVLEMDSCKQVLSRNSLTLTLNILTLIIIFSLLSPKRRKHGSMPWVCFQVNKKS